MGILPEHGLEFCLGELVEHGFEVFCGFDVSEVGDADVVFPLDFSE